jgi:hypothetical protein
LIKSLTVKRAIMLSNVKPPSTDSKLPMKMEMDGRNRNMAANRKKRRKGQPVDNGCPLTRGTVSFSLVIPTATYSYSP